MKKNIFFILLVIAFASCKKGDNSTPATTDLSIKAPSLIIGQWKEGATTNIYYYNGTEVYRENTVSTNKYTFKSDGTVDEYILPSNGNTYSFFLTFNYSFTNANKTIVLSNNGTSNYDIAFTDNNTFITTYTAKQGNTYTINGISYNSYSSAVTNVRQ